MTSRPIERACVRQNASMTLLHFHSIYKVLYAVDLKHSSVWPSADVEPMSNDLVHAMS